MAKVSRRVRVIRFCVAHGVLVFPILVSLYVNDMPELALYAKVMAIITMSRSPTLLVSYLESYLNDLERWLTECRIVLNVSMSTAIIFVRARRRYIEPRPLNILGEQFQWVDTARYLGVIPDTRLIWCLTSIRSKRKLLK
jgi:hypothetical protein